MNKVYKVIWSKAKNCYVVASELAKSHTKSPASGVLSRTLVAGVLASVLSCGAVMPVSVYAAAADTVTSSAANTTKLFLLGHTAAGTAAAKYDSGIYATTTSGQLHVGSLVSGGAISGTTGTFTGLTLNSTKIVLGSDARADALKSVAIGYGAVANASNSVAIGDTAHTNEGGTHNIAIGYGANTYGGIAIGKNAQSGAEGSIASYAVSLGWSTSALGNHTTVIGSNSVINRGEVLSFDSLPEGWTQASDYAARDADGKMHYVPTSSSLAIGEGVTVGGNAPFTVAVGNNSYIGSNSPGSISLKGSIGDDNYGTVAVGMSTAVGNNVYGSVAIGNNTTIASNSSYSVGIGNKARINENAIAGVAIGSGAVVNESTSAVALGRQSAASEDDVVSFGHKTTDSDFEGNAFEVDYTRRLVNVSDGIDPTDVSTVGQLTTESTARSDADTGLSNRIGSLTEDGNYIRRSATNDVSANLLALDTQLKATDTSAIKYDGADRSLATLGGTSGTKLSNLRAGTLSATSTDAVTGAQLYATNQNIAGFANDINRNKESIRNLNTSVSSALESVSSTSGLVNTINNLKADASLNNLTAAGQQVIATAAVNAVQEYMAAQNNSSNAGTNTANPVAFAAAPTSLRILKAGSLNAAPMSPTASTDATNDTDSSDTAEPVANTGGGMRLMSINPAPATTNYVVYDDASASTITLEGATGIGTKITNVADGEVSASSMDAVTGKQLYATQQMIDDIDDALLRNNTSIAQAQTDINNMKNDNLTLQSDVNTLKTQVSTGFNVSVEGSKVKAVTPASNFINFKGGDGVTVSNDNGSVLISVDGDGVIASGNTGAVTGGVAYTELRPANGNYIAQANTTAANLTTLDTQLKTVTDGLAQEVADRTTAVTNEQTVRASADTNLSNRIGTVTNGTYNYIQQSASKNVAENLVLLDTALKATNDTVASNKTAIEEALAGEADTRQDADTALSNRIDALSGNAVHYDGDAKTKVTLEGTGGTTLDNVKAGTLSANSMEAVNGSQLYSTNQALAQEVADRTTAVTNEATARETADTNLSNRIGVISTDGNYVKDSEEKNVSENLSILDTNLKRVDDALTREIADRTTAVTNEATAREQADTALGERIDAVSGNTVHYDGATKTKVILEGNGGTTIDNVKAGTLSANSTEAVNGSQLYSTNQALAQEVTDRTTAVENEATAREAADTALSGRIGTISADGNYIKKSDDKNLSENIGLLDTALKATNDTVASNKTAIESALADEADTRQNADTALSNRIDSLSGNAVIYDTNGKTKITLDGTGGTTIDNVKGGALSADSMEAVNGSQLYSTNQALAQEVTDRTTAVNAEATARREADETLQDNIDALSNASTQALQEEIANRVAGDTALSDRIGSIDANGNYITKDGTVFGNLSALDTQLKTTTVNLAQEITDRTTAITNEATAREVADNALSDRIGSINAGGTYNYITSGNNVSQNLVLLDTQAKTNVDAIIAEQTARENAINQVINNISTFSGNVIQYDGETKGIATLGGTAGTVLANVKGGALNATSMQAVNGSQLYAVKQDIAGFANDISRNKQSIRDMNSSISTALQSVSSASQLVDTINSLKADASLNNLTAAGQQVIASAAANAVQEYMASQSSTNSTNATPPVAPKLMASGGMRLMSVNPAPADTFKFLTVILNPFGAPRSF